MPDQMTPNDPSVVKFFEEASLLAYRLAKGVAVNLGHGEVTSAHLVYGLVAQRHGAAALALAELGLDYARVGELREQLRELKPRQRGTSDTTVDTIEISHDLRQVLELAHLVADTQEKYLPVGTEHLLLALIMERSNQGRMRFLLKTGLGHRPGVELLILNRVNFTQLRIKIAELTDRPFP